MRMEPLLPRAPLFPVTMLSSQPEIQYVALRNINLIVQKRWGAPNLHPSPLHPVTLPPPSPPTRPEILCEEMKVFFVKYNDPIYVKLEKLDIMIRLANEQNIAQVLSELKE